MTYYLPTGGTVPSPLFLSEEERRCLPYAETHSTDILGIRGSRELVCLECAILLHFCGEDALFEQVDYGHDTSRLDAREDPYDVIHYANVERDPDFQQWGQLVCTQCRRVFFESESGGTSDTYNRERRRGG